MAAGVEDGVCPNANGAGASDGLAGFEAPPKLKAAAGVTVLLEEAAATVDVATDWEGAPNPNTAEFAVLFCGTVFDTVAPDEKFSGVWELARAGEAVAFDCVALPNEKALGAADKGAAVTVAELAAGVAMVSDAWMGAVAADVFAPAKLKPPC